MDHIGVTPGVADSINNGADDDASGTAGIIELAEAFSRPAPGQALADVPYGERRGEGALGQPLLQRAPGGPLDRIVANMNIDMIGRNWPDTIVAIGKEHSDLGRTLERVKAGIPSSA